MEGKRSQGEAGALPTPRPAARLDGISKRFGATQALERVTLELFPAEAHALVGENGAGKSTLVKIFAGVHEPDTGRIELDGAPVQIHGPAHARKLGVAVIHQEPRLFPDLSVAENVFLGHQPQTRLGSIDWASMRRAADGLFAQLDVSISADSPVRGLSMADQQLVAWHAVTRFRTSPFAFAPERSCASLDLSAPGAPRLHGFCLESIVRTAAKCSWKAMWCGSKHLPPRWRPESRTCPRTVTSKA